MGNSLKGETLNGVTQGFNSIGQPDDSLKGKTFTVLMKTGDDEEKSEGKTDDDIDDG